MFGQNNLGLIISSGTAMLDKITSDSLFRPEERCSDNTTFDSLFRPEEQCSDKITSDL